MAAIALAAVISPARAATPDVRGGRVGWARLTTPFRHWAIHSQGDAPLAAFIRKETTLNIDPTWYSADVGKLDELCTYPWIYVKDLSWVRKREHLENVQRYLTRGGFMCIDACMTATITPNMDVYYRENRDLLLRLLPGAEARLLRTDHPIYRCYFEVSETDIYTRDMGRMEPPSPAGLTGIFHNGRMVAVLGMYGLQCGWPQTPMRVPGCMKMIVNIYVYAMTYRREPAAGRGLR